MERQKVWVPDAKRGFILGRIVDLGTDEVTILPQEKGLKEITCPYDRVYPAEENDTKDVDDNCRSSTENLFHSIKPSQTITINSKKCPSPEMKRLKATKACFPCSHLKSSGFWNYFKLPMYHNP